MNWKRWSVVLMFGILTACSSSRLSREQAQTILMQMPPGEHVGWSIARPQFDAFLRCAQRNGVFNGGASTPLGDRILDYGDWVGDSYVIKFHSLKRLSSGVTGVADGTTPNTKSVTFTLQYVLPNEMKECLNVGPQPATASFKLYDDGWRIEKVE